MRAGMLVVVVSLCFATTGFADEVVKIGMNYPRTGPYFAQGLDQLRAATLAVNEINAAGGIDGKKIELVVKDSKSDVETTKKNVTELIDKDAVKMVFGGAASSVAVAAGHVCEEKGIVFFPALTYANDTTGKEGHRHTFRECNNAWMSAKVLARYLRKTFDKKKYFYVTANYSWGWSVEESLRHFTNTTDKAAHKSVLTPFPNASAEDFKKAIAAAAEEKPDVLVLVLFGQDMVNGINLAAARGLKDKMQIVVPNLTLAMAESAGPTNMEGVIGTIPWTSKVPFDFNYERGKQFVNKFLAEHSRPPDTSGASAYTILFEYKDAVERAHSFDSPAVIKALEGHTYQLLKDKQTWRAFDHQSVQTVYTVRCKAADKVREDAHHLDYFEIIDSMPGEEAAQTLKEWQAERKAAGKPLRLERLAGES